MADSSACQPPFSANRIPILFRYLDGQQSSQWDLILSQVQGMNYNWYKTTMIIPVLFVSDWVQESRHVTQFHLMRCKSAECIWELFSFLKEQSVAERRDLSFPARFCLQGVLTMWGFGRKPQRYKSRAMAILSRQHLTSRLHVWKKILKTLVFKPPVVQYLLLRTKSIPN